MSTPDPSINSKILESAKEEFLSKGFKEASLRGICKNAGVTTGALYKRFSGKDELFEAVVFPTLSEINEMVVTVEKKDYKYLDKNEIQGMWDMSAETLKRQMSFMYEKYYGIKLLLCCSEGSAFSNFLNDFVADHTERTLIFAQAAHAKGITQDVIDADELHMLLTAFWSTFFEPIIHGLTEEKAKKHCEVIARFFNWQAVLGF